MLSFEMFVLPILVNIKLVKFCFHATMIFCKTSGFSWILTCVHVFVPWRANSNRSNNMIWNIPSTVLSRVEVFLENILEWWWYSRLWNVQNLSFRCQVQTDLHIENDLSKSFDVWPFVFSARKVMKCWGPCPASTWCCIHEYSSAFLYSNNLQNWQQVWIVAYSVNPWSISFLNLAFKSSRF
jgi:hypothetical protein